jgi:hypothetical protein
MSELMMAIGARKAMAAARSLRLIDLKFSSIEGDTHRGQLNPSDLVQIRSLSR